MSICNEILESKEFRRFVNKRSARPNKYFLWSPEESKPNGFESDDFCHLLRLANGVFEHVYLALDKGVAYPIRYKPLAPCTLQASVNIALRGVEFDGIITFISSLQFLSEKPAVVKISWWESMGLLFQKLSTPSMQTDSQYADHIESLMKDALPRLGCQPGLETDHYPWKL